MTGFEDLLARDGKLIYRTRGVSMEPMLRQNRDLVVIRPPSSRLKKYDVALYKRGKAYVLHRVLKVASDHYIIRGDNTYVPETVPDTEVIGVLSGFQRKGKQISVDDRGYQIYARFWHMIYPLRYAHRQFRGFLVSVARRLGILPFLKRMLRKNGAA